ncbi:MAG: recombination-associated protein RdgC [Aquabacterium sp.]
MIKHANLYRIGEEWTMSTPDIDAELKKFAFVPCGSLQTLSAGWVPPRGVEHGALVEQQGQHKLLKLCIETKAVPSQVLDKRVNELAKQVEEQTGRKPGKKAHKELKERALEELLPAAFPKTTMYYVWIDQGAQLIVIDAASESKADYIMTMLVRSLPGISVARFVTNTDPSRAMAGWLLQTYAHPNFSIDREVDLKSQDELKSAASYKGCNLDTAEIREHILQGKAPVKLAMTWRDRISFLLSEHNQIKRIEFLDVVLSQNTANTKDEAWDADVAIATGELTQLIPELIDALGGLAASDLFTPAPADEAKPTLKASTRSDGAEAPWDGPSDSALLAQANGEDELYQQAVHIVVEHKRASISLVQRHLRIGYKRAARLLEAMEHAGLVSAMDTAGNRIVLLEHVE